MAYNPSLYTPYGSQQFQPTTGNIGNLSYMPTVQPISQPPVNGLIRIEGIDGAHMYQLPPNSVSPPLFLEEENAFFIKRTDGGGAASLKKYTFQEEEITNNNSGDFVTREYFDQQINQLMEAINGQHVIPGTTPQFDPQQPAADSIAGSVQRHL